MKKQENSKQYKYGRNFKGAGSVLLAALLMAAVTGCGQSDGRSEDISGLKTGIENVTEISGERTESAESGGEASEPQTGVTFDGKELTETESAIYEKICQAAGQAPVLFDCADFDGDGQEEGFALTGAREDGVVSGKLWFAEESGGAVNVVPESIAAEAAEGGQVSLMDASYVYEMPDGKKLWQVETFGGSVSTSLLWSVEDGAVQESVLSGKGSRFEKTGENDYLLYKSETDAGTDGTGRTEKPCYFFYENGDFHEYGAVSLAREDILDIPGFQEVMASYEDKGFWNRRILLRGNGMVQVSFQDRFNNYYVTLAMKDGRLENVQEGEGLAGLLIGGIADQSWRGGDDALKAVWDKIAAENPGVNVRIYPEESAYYDLDGDGRLEKLRYQEKESAESEDFVNGLTVFVNGEAVWEDTEDWAEWCRLYLTDMDSSDQRLELIAEYCSANDVVVSVKFLQFENGKMTEAADLCKAEGIGENSVIRYQSGRVPECFGPVIPGDKTVTAWMDTPFWRDGFGSYYVKMEWQYENGALTEVKAAEYELHSLSDGRQWPYKLTVPVTLYSDAACTTPVYEAGPGESLYANALRPADGADAPLFIRVEVADENGAAGVTGWIEVGNVRIFEEIPAWG